MNHIVLKNASHHYIQKTKTEGFVDFPVLEDVSLEVKEGEFVTIFGPNGSGKSTLLRVISGLETPSAGSVSIGGEDPKNVRIGFVFQDYRSSMLPWRNVFGNVALALEARGVQRSLIESKTMHYLEQVKMQQYSDKEFWQLSGGMSQAVAIARALAFEPKVLLLDEPFSALDFETTLRMMLILLDVWSKNQITTLFISHQIEEAVFLADRVVVLSSRPGRIKEIIPVTFPRPRNVGILESPEFFSVRNKVLEAFRADLSS